MHEEIVVGVDGSEPSFRAVTAAARLAAATGSVLRIVYALAPLALSPLVDGTALRRMREQERAFARTLLQAQASRAGKVGLQIRTTAVEGFPVDALIAVAREEGVWLLVVGHTGRGAISRAFLGSVSAALAAKSPRSLLIVR